MELANAINIVDKLQAEGDDSAHIDEGYSGRGMYGEETTGVVCSSVQDCCRVMGELGIKDTTRTDNMGYDYIVY